MVSTNSRKWMIAVTLLFQAFFEGIIFGVSYAYVKGITIFLYITFAGNHSVYKQRKG